MEPSNVQVPSHQSVVVAFFIAHEQHVTIQYRTGQDRTGQDSTVQDRTVQYSTVQYSTVDFSGSSSKKNNF